MLSNFRPRRLFNFGRTLAIVAIIAFQMQGVSAAPQPVKKGSVRAFEQKEFFTTQFVC